MLTLDIRHIHYTALLHALATAACRHAERAPEAYAEDLYRVSRQINDISLYIQNTNLATILNSALPLPTSIDPILEDENGPAALIIATLRQHPGGLTNAQLAEHIADYSEDTIKNHTNRLAQAGQLTYTHDTTSPYKTKIYTLTPASPSAAAPAAVPAPTPTNLIIAALRSSPTPLSGIQIAQQTKLQFNLVHKHIQTLLKADIIHHTNHTVPLTYTLTHQQPLPQQHPPAHPAVTGRDGIPDRVIQVLLHEPNGLTGQAIADAIHYNYQSTMTTIARLVKSGHIHRTTGTRPTLYTLVTQPAPNH